MGGRGAYSYGSYTQAVNRLPVIAINDKWAFNPNNAPFEIDKKDIVKNPIRFVGVGRDEEMLDKLFNTGKGTGREYNYEISIDKLETLQPFVLKSGLTNRTADELGEDSPSVYEYKGKYYLVDGNHRVVSDKLHGKKKTKVTLYHVIDK